LAGQRQAKRGLDVAVAGNTTSSRNVQMQQMCKPTYEVWLSDR
jgi:hypothetical protein